MNISKLSEKCQKCRYASICDEKRKVACAYMASPEPYERSAFMPAANSASAEMLVKHNYRDIKIGPTETVTIDLEEQKLQLRREIYKALGAPGFYLGQENDK